MYTRVWNVEWVGWCLFVGCWLLVGRCTLAWSSIMRLFSIHLRKILIEYYVTHSLHLYFECCLHLDVFVGWCSKSVSFLCGFYERKMHLCGFNQRMRWVQTKKQHIIKRCDDLLKMLMCFFSDLFLYCSGVHCVTRWYFHRHTNPFYLYLGMFWFRTVHKHQILTEQTDKIVLKQKNQWWFE